jgi:hypothetical protein
VPASTHLDAPASTAPDAPAASQVPPSNGGSAAPAGGRRRPRYLLVGALIAVVGLVGGFAVQQVVAADAAATAAEQRTARADLAREVETVRSAVADPARDGQNAASALLRHQLFVIAGETPDASVGDRLVEELRVASDGLAEAATTPIPQRPSILPVATVDPVFDRLAGLEGQASELAATFADVAEDAASWLAALRGLDDAALAYAGSVDQLPAGDDPDVIAAAWRAEHERLDAYADAVERASDHEASAPLAEAHGQLVDGMRTVADDAVRRLDAGDVDGYNALLADRLAGDDPFGFAAALEDARAEVADATIDGPLEETRGLALGLLTELEELRRVTPAQLAELP